MNKNNRWETSYSNQPQIRLWSRLIIKKHVFDPFKFTELQKNEIKRVKVHSISEVHQWLNELMTIFHFYWKPFW